MEEAMSKNPLAGLTLTKKPPRDDSDDEDE